MKRQRTVNRRATDELIRVVNKALAKQGLTPTEAAREAKLPANAFRALLTGGHRPTVDRADELLRSLGATLTLGREDPSNEDKH